MNLQESGEMYLESIYVLCKEKKNVRSIDIVEYMNFSKPSVSRAVGLLKSGGYITVDTSGFITLTDVGLEVSRKIYERHSIISAFLISIPTSITVVETNTLALSSSLNSLIILSFSSPDNLP